MKKTLLTLAAAASLGLPAVPAAADPPQWAPAHGWRAHHGYSGYRTYDRYGRYYQPRVVYRRDIWRGRDGRYYCRRSNGTTGLIVGAATGALLGRSVSGYRGRGTGTVLGAAIGGLLGRQIDRGEVRCR